MNIFRLLQVVLLSSAFAQAVLAFPSEVKLTNGAVLHKCSPVRWTSDYVVIKHVGGTDPIRFSAIAPEQRAEIMAARAQSETVKAAAPAAPKTLHVEGQCFITTKGAGAYKMSEVSVMFFPATVASLFETNMTTVDLPRPLQVCTSDADGKFSVELKPDEGPWFVVAQAKRHVGAASNRDPWEYYEWRLPFDGQAQLKLTGQNCYDHQHQLRISE
jgi:hypothetical protein